MTKQLFPVAKVFRPARWTEENVVKINASGTSLDERIKHPDVKGLSIRIRAQQKDDGTYVVGDAIYTHYYVIGGKGKRIPIGEVGATSLENAIQKSVSFANGMTGENPISPVVARREALSKLSMTFGEAVKLYVAHLDKRVEDLDITAAYRNSRRLYLTERAKSLHSHPVKQVSREALRDLLKDPETVKRGEQSVENLRTALSSFFFWAIGEGHCDNDPTTHLPKREKVTRTNVPQISELAALWNAADLLIAQRPTTYVTRCGVANRYGIIMKLLLLTAARRSQIGQLRWDEVRLEPPKADKLPPHIMLEGKLSKDERRRIIKAGGTVAESRSKNRLRFMIVLSRQAVQLLRDLRKQQLAENNGVLPTCVFSGSNKNTGFTCWGQGKEHLIEAAGLAGWIHHDFRRSLKTIGRDDVKIDRDVLDISINHKPQAQQGTNASYDFATLKDERQDGAQRWADYLEGVANEQKPEPKRKQTVLRLAA